MQIDNPIPLLEIEGLKRYYAAPRASLGATAGRRVVRALDGVTISIARGETLGIVGESGCGKSTLARTVAGLLRPSEGEIRYHPPLVEENSAKPLPGRIQMIFQDPYGSFNPRMRARSILREPLTAAAGRRGKRRREWVTEVGSGAVIGEAIEAVGLGIGSLDRYPHEFSGGQRQRLAIARAIVTRPALIVADEAVSALDVSVQAQILNVLMELRAAYEIAILFISHDIAVVEQMSDRVAVMYAGEIVETGPVGEVTASPRHPYTRALLASCPGSRRLESDAAGTIARGEAPSPLSWPPGCRFHPRCPSAVPRCRCESPSRHPTGPNGWASCHLLREG